MATVATLMTRAPAWVQARYSATYFVNWINEMLQRCSSEPRLFKSLRVEKGVTVDDTVWIDKPSGMREVYRIFNPSDEGQQYNFRYSNNRIKLEGATVEDYVAAATASSFSNYSTTYIDVNLSSATLNQYDRYLFRITAGTYAGRTYILDGNTASSGGTCRLYFRHPLSAALTGTNVTAAQLIAPEYYVIMEYMESFTSVTSSSDEVPLDDDYEYLLTTPWLNYKVFDEISPSSNEAGKKESDFEQALKKIKKELRSGTGGRCKPRYSPGWDQFKGSDNDMKTFAEDI